ncbi:MAG: C4-dicarboxylate ABC transporter permease [Deltaproteobacteria bacterium HGW-Deltaproteobacteria-15]|nr:MAG: C4-dicarboxylate ABC transporter permease [Deltaproteobacteria bacterium HGW-Deltaproteobacteria-15]
MSETAVGLIGLLVLIAGLFSRMPVGFVMAFVGTAGFAYLVSWESAFHVLAKDFFGIFSSYSLAVVPLFILMGQITFHAGISRRLFDTAYKLVGHLPGGLAMATIGACAGFAAICGSTNAAAATMATVAIPEMKRYKYSLELATGTVAAGGSLGILIPPSVVFIIYGILTEQSIGRLFVAGIAPGILLSILFIATILFLVNRRPEIAPAGTRTTSMEKFRSIFGVWETLVLFILVMGGLFAGLFTPSEAGAIGAGGSILLGWLRKRLSWNSLKQSLIESARISCMVLVIVAGAVIFGRFLAASGMPDALANWMSDLPFPSYAVMGLIILIYLMGGCFIDGLALILLTIPIFYPVVIKMGYDPIWFGVIIVLVGMMGAITPPVGINVYVVNGVVKDVPLETIFKGALPFLVALVICALILIPFPQIALFLPSLMK